MDELTPDEIVKELDKYIIGQNEAKRSVAIALRNRYRRQRLLEELRDEVAPKNIIMIGPTGVGKTEIARRLARMVNAPFLKVEATKFTEVGYVGRDVESMVRELTNIAVNMVKSEKIEALQEKVKDLTQEKILDILLPHNKKKRKNEYETEETTDEERFIHTREKLRQQLSEGKLEDRQVEIETKESFTPVVEIFAGTGMEGLDVNFTDALSSLFPSRTKRRKTPIKEARKILLHEETQKLIDMDEVIREAISRTENGGIIFLDEIDKIVGREGTKGPDVSREGVQRDILPIVEGSTVMTRYGPVRTDHILFIAAGTFHSAKPSDLIPELQGRFPIRVELSPLSEDDFKEILTKPKNALIKQYTALLATEDVELVFEDEAIEEIAKLAREINEKTENIGARRLYTLVEKVVEDISFEANKRQGERIEISSEYVREKLKEIIKDRDLSRYIL
ncbi:TPA: HslU--HslV peptidase ATPase subunit [bacterium]|nr:HslU--HslV peptidase ATPase subunit [bacterium]